MDTRTECLQDADFRRRRRRLTIAIVAAFVAIDVVIWFGGFDRPGGWNAIDAFVVGSVACQICLLSVWVALGEQYFFVRVLCVTPLCLLVAWLVADQEFTKEAWQTGGFMLLLLYFVGAIIPRGILRLFDLHCVCFTPVGAGQNASWTRGPVQFSLAGLFKLTFVAACAAGINRLLDQPVRYASYEVAQFGLLVCIGLASALAALTTRPRRLWLLLLWLPVASFGLAGTVKLLDFVTGNNNGPWPQLAWSGATLTAFTIGVLALYRRLGYRIVRGMPAEIAPAPMMPELFAP